MRFVYETDLALEPFQMGLEFQARGLSLMANPFPFGTPERARFRDGWYSARQLRSIDCG
jgi:hypothetical protein